MSYHGMTKAEGDEIALAVLSLVAGLVQSAKDHRGMGLDHNVRPEPPEARLGYMPQNANPQVNDSTSGPCDGRTMTTEEAA